MKVSDSEKYGKLMKLLNSNFPEGSKSIKIKDQKAESNISTSLLIEKIKREQSDFICGETEKEDPELISWAANNAE